MQEEAIGVRLRQVRTARQLSQRQLARQSGVANATISQIEAAKLNPTVGLLKRVLDGLPMSLGEFFGDEGLQEDRIFFRASELTDIADGGVSYRQVGSNLAGSAIQLIKECYQPGATTGRHAISHDGEECGIVLSGRLEVIVGDQRAVLGAGDAYYFNSHQPHQFKNAGREPCDVISACTPPTF